MAQGVEFGGVSVDDRQSEPSDRELRAFVGESRAAYYLPRFAAIRGGDLPSDPVLAAGLFHFWWLCYWRLIPHALLSAAFLGVCLGLASELASAQSASFKALSIVPTHLLVGGLGAHWLYGRSVRVVGEIHRRVHDEEARIAEAAQEGQPSLQPVFTFAPLCVALAFVARWAVLALV